MYIIYQVGNVLLKQVLYYIQHHCSISNSNVELILTKKSY